MVDEGFIFTLDDDIMFNKTDVIENCLKTYETIGEK
jgi:UTP-glucose-1-phosphate uridylyltransferase